MSDDARPPEDYEEQHVHSVYEQIADHFSSTRYKPWPIIEHFLQNLPAGAVGVDVGCGNGKYLGVNQNVFIVGSDRSTNLTNIARKHRQHDAVVADALDVPHRPGTMDFAISIAVVHHLSTPERRIEAVKQLLVLLRRPAAEKEGGKALVYVWALEQKHSRRGWDEGDDQDVMVPWVMKGSQAKAAQDSKAGATSTGQEDQTFHRYYHLYRKGELESDMEAAGGTVVKSGYEKDNWWVIARRKSD